MSLDDLGNIGDFSGARTFALPGARVWWARGKHVYTAQLQGRVDREGIGSKPAV